MTQKLPNIPSGNFETVLETMWSFLNHEHFRREQEDQVEVGKELMRQEFTEWLNQVLAKFPKLKPIQCQLNAMMQVEMVAVESSMLDVQFGEIREFHRCEACLFPVLKK